MTELKAGQQYLVSNIRFLSKDLLIEAEQRIDKFTIPASVDEIQEWLEDYGIEATDEQALVIYVRSRLFYYFDMMYDYQLLETNVHLNERYGHLVVADTADHKYAEYTTATIDIHVPDVFVCELCTDDIAFAENDTEQALFENMIHALPISIDIR